MHGNQNQNHRRPTAAVVAYALSISSLPFIAVFAAEANTSYEDADKSLKYLLYTLAASGACNLFSGYKLASYLAKSAYAFCSSARSNSQAMPSSSRVPTTPPPPVGTSTQVNISAPPQLKEIHIQLSRVPVVRSLESPPESPPADETKPLMPFPS